MLALLNAGSPPCVFERVRTTEIGDADLPSGILCPVDGKVERASSTRLRAPAVRTYGRWMLELRAKGTASIRADAAVDPLYVWAIAKLGGAIIADGAASLNFDLEEGDYSYSYEQGETPVCLLSVELIVGFQHLTANAESRT